MGEAGPTTAEYERVKRAPGLPGSWLEWTQLQAASEPEHGQAWTARFVIGHSAKLAEPDIHSSPEVDRVAWAVQDPVHPDHKIVAVDLRAAASRRTFLGPLAVTRIT